jgi:hypothetical protein
VKGSGEIYTIDPSGNFSTPLVNNDWRSTWSTIVPLGGTKLLFYAPNDGDIGAGLGEVSSLGLQPPLKSNTDWRSSWSIIQELSVQGTKLLLFYAPHDGTGGSGYGEFDYVDADGISIYSLDKGRYDGWRSSWTKIVASGDATSHGLILFYAPHDGVNGAGLGEFYSVDKHGQMSLALQSYKDWRSSWDIIQMVPSSLPGYSFLLLYDSRGGNPGCGYAEVHSVDGQGRMNLLFTASDWRSTWTNIRMFRMISGAGRVRFFLEGMGLLFYAPHDGVDGIRQGFIAQDTAGLHPAIDSPGMHPSAGAPRIQREFIQGQVSLRMGYGELYLFDAQGVPRLLNKFDTWRSSWTNIVSFQL